MPKLKLGILRLGLFPFAQSQLLRTDFLHFLLHIYSRIVRFFLKYPTLILVYLTLQQFGLWTGMLQDYMKAFLIPQQFKPIATIIVFLHFYVYCSSTCSCLMLFSILSLEPRVVLLPCVNCYIMQLATSPSVEFRGSRTHNNGDSAYIIYQ